MPEGFLVKQADICIFRSAPVGLRRVAVFVTVGFNNTSSS